MTHPLQAPIRRVTLLEDRAYIYRQGNLDLPAGRSHWRLQDVSALLVDKTLGARLEGSARVVQVTVERILAPLPAPDPAPDPQIAAQIQRRRLHLQEQALLQEREYHSVLNFYDELTQQICKQVGWGVDETAAWEEELGELSRWKERLVEERHTRLLELEALDQEGFRPLAAAPEAVESLTEIVVEVDSPSAQSLPLSLEYSLPCACWRPSHQAVLQAGRLEFISEATCWQNTGEDWNEVDLVFSTQRFTLGNEPPTPVADTLRTKKKSAEVVVSERDLDIQELPKGGPAPTERASEVPGIDDGGQAIQLRASHKASVPSHGKPVRIALAKFHCEAELENVLMAEVCPEVVQKSRQTNTSPHPLLAGPVDLIRESGLIGRGRLLYVAAAEPFTLGWGPLASLRAVRQTQQGNEEKDDLLGGWVRIKHTVEITISNLSSESHAVKVMERIPVSELKQVEVVFDAKLSSPGATPDANGFLCWQVELGARARHHLKLAYSLRRRKEVVTA